MFAMLAALRYLDDGANNSESIFNLAQINHMSYCIYIHNLVFGSLGKL